MEADHEAGEEPDDENDGQAAHALFVNGAHEAPPETARAHGRGETPAGEAGEVAGFSDDAKGGVAEGGEHGVLKRSQCH